MIHSLRLQNVVGLLTAAVILLTSFGQAQAALLFNEISINSENSGGSGSDDGKEFIEIISDTGGVESLSGLTVLVIEGDGASQGIIDRAFPLSGSDATGTNGLFLMRDQSNVLLPAPDAATVVKVGDFGPGGGAGDLENGSATFLLVAGFTGAETDNLDADDDGILDSTPWTSVLDAIGILDAAATDNVYAAQLGFVDMANASFVPDTAVRLADTGEWIAVDTDEVVSEFPGPYTLDDAQAQRADGTPFTPSTALTFNALSPGNANPANVVPEPVSATLLGIAGLLLVGAKRRK